MDIIKFVAWLLLNVGVPLLAPIALLPLLLASRKLHAIVGKLIRRSLQEGQLFWTVIAMCAAACYEAAGQVTGTDARRATGWLLISWHVLVIVASSVLVLLGTIDEASDESTSAIEATPKAPTVMILSIWMAVIVAITFSATHLWAG